MPSSSFFSWGILKLSCGVPRIHYSNFRDESLKLLMSHTYWSQLSPLSSTLFYMVFITSHQRILSFYFSNQATPLNFGVCARRKVPAKRFNIYQILKRFAETFRRAQTLILGGVKPFIRFTTVWIGHTLQKFKRFLLDEMT